MRRSTIHAGRRRVSKKQKEFSAGRVLPGTPAGFPAIDRRTPADTSRTAERSTCCYHNSGRACNRRRIAISQRAKKITVRDLAAFDQPSATFRSLHCPGEITGRGGETDAWTTWIRNFEGNRGSGLEVISSIQILDI